MTVNNDKASDAVIKSGINWGVNEHDISLVEV